MGDEKALLGLPRSDKTILDQMTKPGPKTQDTCEACKQKLRAPCAYCGVWVKIIGGVTAPHQRFVCTGSHMEYGGCPGSNKAPRAHHE